MKSLLLKTAITFMVMVIVIIGTTDGRAQMLVAQNGSEIGEDLDAPLNTVLTSIGSSNSRLVLKHFNKHFYNISDARWYKVNDGLVTKFKQETIPYTVSYSATGIWKHTIKYLNESATPEDLKKIIRSKFDGYSVLRAREIQIPGTVIYLVQIQKDKHYKEISVHNKRIRTLKSLYPL
ncbi:MULTISPECIES: hypothetical protein [Olivibacter]|jgi:hypothetical protein|uniref:PepSY-like beta-lactamase-inhibitor n=3 Tax=Olivibacter TaxID=376469 RepID=A0ABV6HLG2_9SPHI|nr:MULTISPECIES: hypothetical protein [Olivibacter]MCL4640785.1 hypothetical protein [Olivibacter sp. UJ_SKK_5.1]MDX3914385.1 hypothetical protein [Pseudosphingobacterium sp.]QEL02508.1 hypothetical protein FKG96_17370 [Olivibacter sp. LS-1]